MKPVTNYPSAFSRIKNAPRMRSPNDTYFTPEILAKKCISLMPFSPGDTVCDNAPSNPVFYDNYPSNVTKLLGTPDFFDWNTPVDWFCTNPPFSIYKSWLIHSFEYARKGFGYICPQHFLHGGRLRMLARHNFFVSKMYVFEHDGLDQHPSERIYNDVWWSDSFFIVFERERKLVDFTWEEIIKVPVPQTIAEALAEYHKAIESNQCLAKKGD